MIIDHLFLGFRIVIPVFSIVALGHLAARKNFIRRESFVDMNNLVFSLLLPAQLFYSIASETDSVLDLRLMGFVFASTLVLVLLLLSIIPRIQKNPLRTGVMMQAIYRGNFLILGLPILSALYDSYNTDLSASVLLVIIPLFNVLSITMLNFYAGKKTDIKTLLLSIVTSPLVVATLLGLAMMPFRIPSLLLDSVELLAQISTPLALFVLGGLLDAADFRENWRDLNIITFMRLILVPFVTLHVAHYFGFRAEQLMTLMVFAAAPTAVVSYSMTLYLGGDARLAQQAILYTTALSVFSYVFWIYYVLSFLA